MSDGLSLAMFEQFSADFNKINLWYPRAECVCICSYIHVYIYIYIDVSTRICVHIHSTYTYKYTNTHIHIHINEASFTHDTLFCCSSSAYVDQDAGPPLSLGSSEFGSNVAPAVKKAVQAESGRAYKNILECPG